MAEVGIDLSGAQPREISTIELEPCDLVATMGCSTLDIDTDVRDWALPDPEGKSPERVREIREEVRTRVRDLSRRTRSGEYRVVGVGLICYRGMYGFSRAVPSATRWSALFDSLVASLAVLNAFPPQLGQLV
jgi:hypothetical protein